MSAVLEEQAWQKLCKEMRRRRGLSGDVDGHFANTCIIRLANIAEEYSRWAKERASVAALALESDLVEACDDGSRSSKDHGLMASRQTARKRHAFMSPKKGAINQER